MSLNTHSQTFNRGLSMPAEIRPYSMKDLIKMYNIPEKSLRSWLKKFEGDIGERLGHFYNIIQVEFIFSKLGAPYVEE